MSGERDPLERLVAPTSIALIGTSASPTGMAGFSLANLMSTGFSGSLYPVNPNRTEVQGVRCFPSVSALPEIPDTALIMVAASRVLSALRECDALGITSATILSSGFGEGEGDEEARARADELEDFIVESGMRILGPNCIGPMDVTNNVVQRAAAFLPDPLRAGHVGVISQSGGASLITMNRAQAAGVGLSVVLPTGNESDIDMAELLSYVAARGDTRVICLFVESVKNPAAFLAAAEDAVDAGIHVVAVKAGASVRGAQAVSSHTGALAGSDAAYDAAFRSVGIRRVRDYDGLHETAALLARYGSLPGRRIGVICVSGAEAASISDIAEELAIELPAPSAATRLLMERELKYGAVANPLDLTGQLFSGDPHLAELGVTAMARDVQYDAILVSITTLGMNVAEWLGPMLVRAQEASGKPILVNWWTAGPRTEEAHRHLRDLGLVVYPAAYRALAAISAASPGVLVGPPAESDRASDPRSNSDHQIISGPDAVRLLEPSVGFVPGAVVESLGEAEAAAARIGYPVVLKLAIPGVAHKTEIGGVELDIDSSAGLRAAYGRLSNAAQGDGVAFEVQRMLSAGVEMLVGVTRDATFGPLVTVGMGGVWTELLREVVSELCPVSDDQARAMINRLRSAPLLHGYRSGVRSDVEALVQTIVRLSECAIAHPEWSSVELNPVVVMPVGAFAVDAVIEQSGALL